MKIIPAINCPDFECVETKLGVIREMQPNEALPWVHIDISDGGFTNGHATWRNPEELKEISGKYNIELHFMVNDPELILEQWRIAGVRRVVVHLESTANVESLLATCKELGFEPVLALRPETPATHALQYLKNVSACQVLAVDPGRSGQALRTESLQKIKEIRAAYPEIVIEVDGGINLETARQCQEAGATELVSASYLFSAPDPIAAYQQLSAL